MPGATSWGGGLLCQNYPGQCSFFEGEFRLKPEISVVEMADPVRDFLTTVSPILQVVNNFRLDISADEFEPLMRRYEALGARRFWAQTTDANSQINYFGAKDGSCLIAAGQIGPDQNIDAEQQQILDLLKRIEAFIEQPTTRRTDHITHSAMAHLLNETEPGR